MRPALPWLAQGDIFERVPVPNLQLAASDQVTVSMHDRGPAVLLTHDCALDKTNRRLDIKIRRLYFMPLLAVSNVDRDVAGALRRNEVLPSESLYVPDAGEFGESYCVLSTAYYLPAEYFDVRLTAFDHPEAEEGAHLEGSRHSERVGRLDADSLELLRMKWSVFWIRLLPDDVPEPARTRPSARRVVIGYASAAQRRARGLLHLK